MSGPASLSVVPHPAPSKASGKDVPNHGTQFTCIPVRPSAGHRGPARRTRTGAVELFLRPEHSLVGTAARAGRPPAGGTDRPRRPADRPVLGLAPAGATWLGHTMALIVVTVLVLSILVIPASRRYLNRRWWSVTTRHRMRACFVQTRTMTHHGRLPLLVWSRPSPVGEKVRVWLPAGLSVKDLERVTTETAAACWAADVRITPSRRQAALVVVDVIRRDPLTGGALTPQPWSTTSTRPSPTTSTWPIPSRTTRPAPTVPGHRWHGRAAALAHQPARTDRRSRRNGHRRHAQHRAERVTHPDPQEPGTRRGHSPTQPAPANRP